MKNCIFCNIDERRILFSQDEVFVIRDKFPVTSLHTLIIPRKHICSYFELSDLAMDNFSKILKKCRDGLLKEDPSISGFNVGINDGVDAGQTVMHCHIHIIPRRNGDTKNPRGGVRGVIPEKQNY